MYLRYASSIRLVDVLDRGLFYSVSTLLWHPHVSLSILKNKSMERSLRLSYRLNVSIKFINFLFQTLGSLFLELSDLTREIFDFPLVSLSRFPLSRESGAYEGTISKMVMM